MDVDLPLVLLVVGPASPVAAGDETATDATPGVRARSEVVSTSVVHGISLDQPHRQVR